MLWYVQIGLLWHNQTLMKEGSNRRLVLQWNFFLKHKLIQWYRKWWLKWLKNHQLDNKKRRRRWTRRLRKFLSLTRSKGWLIMLIQTHFWNRFKILHYSLNKVKPYKNKFKMPKLILNLMKMIIKMSYQDLELLPKRMEMRLITWLTTFLTELLKKRTLQRSKWCQMMIPFKIFIQLMMEQVRHPMSKI